MRRLAALFIAACCILLPAAADAQPLRLVVAGLAKQIYLPPVLADRLGYFAEQGLQVELVGDGSGVRAEDRLLAGAVHGVIGFYDHTLLLQAKGKFVRSVVQLSRAPGEAVVAGVGPAEGGPPIAGPADFRGRTLGVAGLGSSTHLLMQYLGATHGVPPSEMNFVAIDSQREFAEAMASGRIHAGIATEPLITGMLAAGRARLLVDMRTPQAAALVLGGTYPGASLYMSEAWIVAHRSEVQKLVNALVKALRFIDTHSAAEIAAVLPADLVLGRRGDYVAALAASKSMFIPDGTMPADGPAHVLKVLQTASRVMKGRTIDLDRTYTTEFVKAVRP